MNNPKDMGDREEEVILNLKKFLKSLEALSKDSAKAVVALGLMQWAAENCSCEKCKARRNGQGFQGDHQ